MDRNILTCRNCDYRIAKAGEAAARDNVSGEIAMLERSVQVAAASYTAGTEQGVRDRGVILARARAMRGAIGERDNAIRGLELELQKIRKRFYGVWGQRRLLEGSSLLRLGRRGVIGTPGGTVKYTK